jgi:hypothetical protein
MKTGIIECMTTQDVKRDKTSLENNIMKVIDNFQRDTGTRITSIDLEKVIVMGREHPVITRVILKVEI